MTIPFGKYKNLHLSDPSIPDDYIKWLANRGKYQSKTNRFETEWKVPVDIWLEARKEMENRGYERIEDRRWEKYE